MRRTGGRSSRMSPTDPSTAGNCPAGAGTPPERARHVKSTLCGHTPAHAVHCSCAAGERRCQQRRHQISPTQAAPIHNAMGAGPGALRIFAVDFGLADGNFHSSDTRHCRLGADGDTRVTKFGGDRELGDPQPLRVLRIGWQPVLQGNMSYRNSSAKSNLRGRHERALDTPNATRWGAFGPRGDSTSRPQ